MKINISGLKAKLSENLEKVKNGETVIVYDRNTPVAKIIPFKKSAVKMSVRKPEEKLVDMKLHIRIRVDPAKTIMEGRQDR